MGKPTQKTTQSNAGRNAFQQFAKQNKFFPPAKTKGQNFSHRPMTAFHSQKGK